MALAKCDDCGREISTRAQACPFCGGPNEFGIKTPKEPMPIVDVYARTESAPPMNRRVPAGIPRGTPDNPAVIEQTSKRWKAHLLVAGLSAAITLPTYITLGIAGHTTASAVVSVGFYVAILYWIVVRVLTWWHHG